MSIIASALGLSLLASTQPAPGRFLVLAVGVHGYKVESTGFGELNGNLDAIAFVNALKTYYKAGSHPGDQIVLLVKDTETTRASITAALDKLASTSKKGDKVVFFYSGHGTRIPDSSKQSGYSQSIVPIDVKRLRGGVVDPATVISGPTFRTYLDRMGQNGVDNVTMVFDSCHSQNISRGTLKPKSGRPNTAPPAVPDPNAKDTKGWLIDNALAVFSAAQADKEAFEDTRLNQGVLTYEFIDALRRNAERQSSLTYGRFYDELRASVRAHAKQMDGSPVQEPWFEGSKSLDRILFDTRIEPQPRSFATFPDGAVLKIEAGQVHGVKSGCLFGIYKPDAKLTDQPTYRAIARDPINAGTCAVDIVDANGQKVAGAPVKTMKGWPAVILDAQPSGKIKMQLDDDPSAAWVKKVKALAIFEPGTSSSYDVRVTPPVAGTSETSWQVTDAAGVPLASHKGQGDDELVKVVSKAATDEAKRRSVLELGPSGRSIVKVEIEAVRIKTKLVDGYEQVASLDEGGSKSISMLTQTEPNGGVFDQRFALRVRATSPSARAPYAPYVAVLDITPKGEVKPLWPDPTYPIASQSLQLAADGQWRYLGQFNQLVSASDLDKICPYQVNRATDGIGIDSLKVIGTETYITYDALFADARGTRGDAPVSKGLDSPLGRLLSAFAKAQPVPFKTRSGATPNAPPANWSVDLVRVAIEIPDK